MLRSQLSTSTGEAETVLEGRDELYCVGSDMSKQMKALAGDCTSLCRPVETTSVSMIGDDYTVMKP